MISSEAVRKCFGKSGLPLGADYTPAIRCQNYPAETTYLPLGLFTLSPACAVFEPPNAR